MAEAGTKVMAFPELCITGYTCSDLFWQELLLVRAKEELHKLEEELEESGRLDYCGASAGI